ncbi:MAG: hypothetical protein IJY05_00205 [Clostridia bacterium]|nr:hypothetical protein [Clostridia bacterium]
MIDMHTHILPHIDDGAKDSTMSAFMLKKEAEQGVSAVVLTSHYYGKKYGPSHFLERRASAFERIKNKIPEGLEIRLGAEVYFTGVNVAEPDELCKLAIEGTKYILMEFPFTEKWTYELLDKLAEFIGETGYTPIIAHVERYREIKKRPAYITELIDMGCLIQVNTKAFLDKKEKKLVYALLKNGMVHCIGTDTHDLENRAPNYAEAKETAKKAGFEKEWSKIQADMEKILADEKVSVSPPKLLRKFFGKYL